MRDDQHLTDLAGEILDNAPVDWAAADSHATDADRATVAELRVLAEIIELHRHDPQVAGPPAPRDEASAPGGPAPPGIGSWGGLTLLEQVGEGVFGEVFRAWDPHLDREMALKLLRRGAEPNSQAATLIEEGRLLARIRHPNVVSVYGAACLDDRIGIWMEFVSGGTLEDLLRARGPLSAREATLIGVDLCRALAAVHGAGLIHRDVKAQNVMRETGGRIVLMDFGTVHPWNGAAADELASFTGTPRYLAPEVFRGGAVSTRSDLYSAGVLLYHLVTGSYPICGATLSELGHAHQRGDRRRLRDARPDLPADFVETVERALAVEPERRYATAGAFEEALSRTLQTVAHARRTAGRERVRRAAASLAAVVAVVLFASMAFLGWQYSHAPAAGARLGFEARDWLLVTAFDNRTGEPRLTGTVEYALERELGNSRFVNVVSRERISDALQLMRKRPEAPIDQATGREICLRDGGIRALVAGRVEKLGGKFEISAHVIDPVTGRGVLSAAVEAPSEAAILAVVRQLSDRIRVGLGEALGRIQSPSPLEHVTTPSLRALQLYSQGMRLLAVGAPPAQWAAAGELFKQAIKEDPEFASAYVYLSWATPPPQSLGYSERAFQLSEHAGEGERLFIQGSYYGQRQEMDKAIAAYEALVALEPNNYWAVNNLAYAFARRNEPARALPNFVRLAELRPTSLSDNITATEALKNASRDAEAATYYARARALVSPELYARAPASVVLMCFLPVRDHWLGRDVDAAAAALGGLSAKAKDYSGDPAYEERLALWHLALGQFRRAEEIHRRLIEEVPRRWPEKSPEVGLAWSALAHGDLPTARAAMRRLFARSDGAHRDSWTIVVYARAGLVKEARLALKAPPPTGWTPGETSLAAGEIAVAEGRLAEAAGSFRQALEQLSPRAERAHRALAMQSLSQVLERQGHRSAALAALDEAAADRRDSAVRGGIRGLYVDVWLDIQARRAALLRALGRAPEAEPIEAELKTLLARADPDHPILLQLGQVTPTRH